ncbi:hypothetical protein AVEN_231793-1 [Araneus ventricosus]|uniref:Tc1-like transposase DDE domain-containing protein n=1 Tax=Araneus ventricosus TaxID=182803 RepID=A0A4Y2QT67_ARAVE|nr:hypothetical protein AVEN_231793-1 [Araneus ventricosus]
MDDNVRQHRARLVLSYLESETISQMALPARSPDLNPIEHVGYVGKTDCRSQCAARHPLPAPTSLTTGMGITATTSDQRNYCQHASPLSNMHFS